MLKLVPRVALVEEMLIMANGLANRVSRVISFSRAHISREFGPGYMFCRLDVSHCTQAKNLSVQWKYLATLSHPTQFSESAILPH